MPLIAGDFCFLGSDGDEGKLTVFVVVDNKSRIIFARAIPDKAVVNGEYYDYLVKRIVDDINSLGYNRIIFKTDQEARPRHCRARSSASEKSQ